MVYGPVAWSHVVLSRVARKKTAAVESNTLKDQIFTMKILKALFVSNNKMKRFFLLVSYHRLSVKAWETLSWFLTLPEDFDYTEIDRLFRTEICLSDDSESVVRFLQQKEALFVSIATKCSTRAARKRITTQSCKCDGLIFSWAECLFKVFIDAFNPSIAMFTDRTSTCTLAIMHNVW